ncbi:MAG TPA: BtrH N-terminal domain-containing protein, partial [Candidatus Limnocylindrales bacterium]|nr:BtrH N-terminal domain-containing protein [Candidatus Limnocylindrales bacterium]
MTTDKAFKRIVRARMAKTGERYAAARRSLIEADTDSPLSVSTIDTGLAGRTYQLRGGLHPQTATLANVLANQGVVSGLTGEPLTEATILGIGGGLGAGYILWEFKSHGAPILTVGFSNQWQYPWIPGWTGKTLERLGIAPDVHETGGARSAREALDSRLDAGSPVIAWVDLGLIGTWGLPDALEGHLGHTFVIAGREADGTYLVDDRGRAPFRISSNVMASARSRIGSFKNRIVRLETSAGPIPADRLRAALQAGLEDQVDHLRSKSDSFSLPAWRKWARLMTDEGNAKAWPRVFADGQGLFGALIAIVEAVDAGAGPWGGHLRELYATSLDETAVALDRPALADAAAAWRAAADAWDDLGDSAVPSDLEGADDAVEGAETVRSAVNDGEAGRARVRAAAEATWG